MKIPQGWYELGIFKGKPKMASLNKVKRDKTQQNLRNSRKRNTPR